MMGRVLVDDLLTSDSGSTVLLCDRCADLLAEAAARHSEGRLTTRVVDVMAQDEVIAALDGVDVGLAALPHAQSPRLVEAAVVAKTSLVDLVGSRAAEKRALDARARQAGCLVVPGCGVAPGISNFCVGQGMAWLDETISVAIYVGGIPRRPRPPLFYETVFLLQSVLSAYRRPAVIRRAGRPVQVAALSGLETIEFSEPVGQLEAFYTDGLASLPLTVGDRVQNDLYEKTLRCPGHVAGIRLLEQCGLLSEEAVEIDGTSISPVAVLEKTLAGQLALGADGDVLAMRVIVEGRAEGRPQRHVFEVVDFYDPKTGHTAMGRTTSFTAACAARQIAAGVLTETGVRFPEEVFVGDRFDAIVAELATKGVRVVHRAEP